MSGAGAPDGLPDARGLSVAVIGGRWHAQVADALVDRAMATALECGVSEDDISLVRVPGAFELPVVAQAMATDHDAVVCLGVIVRGGTPHFEFVSSAATDGCLRVSLDTGRPVGFGVLTCEDYPQAIARSGLPGSVEDKGREAMLAALETADLLRRIGGAPSGFSPDPSRSLPLLPN